ncbi:MAG: transcriptional repressor [Geodermatophilaceae bacterium]|nr:transcriptional repressor [Geodermatophilaceae bacterium]
MTSLPPLPLARPAGDPGDSDLPQALRSRGYRLTPQRQMVLDAVVSLGAGTVDEIGGVVRRTAPGVNITTVYRTLDLLEELGVVRHRHVGHGAPRYSPAGDDEVQAVCHGCGDVTDMPAELMGPLARWLASQRGFVLATGHIAMTGTCRNCVDAPPS